MARRSTEPDSEPLPVEEVACPLCGEERAEPLFWQRDLALGVPGRFCLARCPGCGLLYQNPRVRADRLAACYPPGYPPHAREPDPSGLPPKLSPPVRSVLANRLGYCHLPVGPLGWQDRLQQAFRLGRLLNAYPPFLGAGRLLDVGCATGRFLSQMRVLGWETAGIEIDPEAAAKARRVTPRIFVGDPTEAPFTEKSFDVVTAFHVLEHLPDPLGALRNMIRWTAPDGLIIVEVPNIDGWGGRWFGSYWAGLELPRHLVQFTPKTMRLMVERAGGRVLRAFHKAKPRSLIRSLRFFLGDRRGPGARLTRALLSDSIGEGALKLLLELTLPLAEITGRGEAVRYFIRRGGVERA